MGIEVRHGTVESIAKLGLLAGQSVAAQREAERAATLVQQAQAQEHQRAMTVYRAQLDLQASMRSQEWELEKMEVRSRMDFEREERERMRKLDDIDSAMRQIDREVESGRITEVQSNALKFRQEMKRYGAAPPVSLIQPPTEEGAEPPTISEQMRAYKILQGEEFKEPTGFQKILPEWAGGKAELTEDELFYRELFEKTAKGIPSGTISQGLPTVRNDADFDALPSGALFIDPHGNQRRKP